MNLNPAKGYPPIIDVYKKAKGRSWRPTIGPSRAYVTRGSYFLVVTPFCFDLDSTGSHQISRYEMRVGALSSAYPFDLSSLPQFVAGLAAAALGALLRSSFALRASRRAASFSAFSVSFASLASSDAAIFAGACSYAFSAALIAAF